MNMPESAHISQPPPVADPDGPRPPESVTLEEFNAALKPLYDLLGTDVMAVFADGFKVTSEAIEYVTCVPVHGSEPVQVGDNPEWAEWGWPVVVKVDL